MRVGTQEGNDARLVDFREDSEGVSFTLTWRGQTWTSIAWSLPGLYNARNAAMAAVACGIMLAEQKGPQGASILPVEQLDPRGIDVLCLSRFRGVKRRQEERASHAGIRVIEDFGHHPTALAETLVSFRSRFPGAVLTAVFEPRSNTARTKALQAGFMRALSQADEVYLGAVNRADKLRSDERFDPEAVSQHLESQSVHARWFSENEHLLEQLSNDTLATEKRAARQRVVIFFSNGSFDGIIGRYAERVGT